MYSDSAQSTFAGNAVGQIPSLTKKIDEALDRSRDIKIALANHIDRTFGASTQPASLNEVKGPPSTYDVVEELNNTLSAAQRLMEVLSQRF